ncbi:MAG: glycosyltransferase [Acidimicrobiaceae bacterium]|nr:glycosyltransferase [Acidimicrobiaceae bacterium]
MRVAIAVEQLSRAQPGGIGSYARGLVTGLVEIGWGSDIVTLGPRGSGAVQPGVAHHSAPLSIKALTRGWSRVPVGVPRDIDVVHATSMAGPFGGGGKRARHTAALHDVLWRDEPGSSTPRGVTFHEARLQRIIRDDSLRIIASSPLLPSRLREMGVDSERIFVTRLGVDESGLQPAEPREVRRALGERGVTGPYTLYVGTLEPRKNVPALVRAHRAARAQTSELGPLVLVGPSGWGHVDVGDAVVLGRQSRELLLGLYRDATVVAYVPVAEGYGLPPVEALYQGTAVVVSAVVPSVATNETAVRVSAHEVDEIAEGLLLALATSSDPAARERRRQSVAELTWANCARDHLAAWS